MRWDGGIKVNGWISAVNPKYKESFAEGPGITIWSVLNNLSNATIYYKNFSEKFLYKGHFFSYKVMPNEKSDKRPTFIKKYNNIVSIFSGKIANIYSAQDYIQKLINKK